MKWPACALAGLLALVSTRADTLFYGGDFDGRNGLSSERMSRVPAGGSLTYDNFLSGPQDWRVEHLFGNYLAFPQDPPRPRSAYYEIRTGVSAGNGGNLIARGEIPGRWTFSRVISEINGIYEWQFKTEQLSIDLAANEMFWLTLAPIGDGAGRYFVDTTSGGDSGGPNDPNPPPTGGPRADGNSYFSSIYFGYYFAETSDSGILGPGTWDFSFGVEGTVLPEPTTGAALLFASALLWRRAARKRRSRWRG